MRALAPLRIVHLDLAEELEPIERPGPGRGVQLVFWWRDLPLGEVELPPAQLPIDVNRLRRIAAHAVALAVGGRLYERGFEAILAEERHLRPRRQPPKASTLATLEAPLTRLDSAAESGVDTTVSVVVCTRDRPEQLVETLHSLQRLSVPPHELIVVDNAPTAGATRTLVDRFPDVRYVKEPRAGLSTARNTGVRHATGEIIAWTDDDAVVHPAWVQRLQAAFDAPDVMAVTGLVLPMALDTEGELLFEKHIGGFGQGYVARTFDATFFEMFRSHGVPVWRLGAGANMAIRRRAFQVVGGFDERLGAGAAGCSEDSEFWYRLLAEGWSCKYEPAAVVFHRHRPDRSSVQVQSRLYTRGHVAALFVQFARYRHWGNLRRALVGLPYYYMRRFLRSMVTFGDSDPTFTANLAGYISGLSLLPRMLHAGALPPSVDAGNRTGRAGLSPFLRQNPFPHPLTEGFYYREKMRAIHRVAPEGPFRRVLEVGGGRSALTSLLYPTAEVTSFDLDVSYAASAANQRSGLLFVGADATQLPFPDDAFDAVTMFDVLEHIADDETAVREAMRVLRPGGSVLVSSPNQWWRFPYYGAFRRFCRTDEEMMAEWGHVRRGYKLEDLDSLMGATHEKCATFITPLTVVGHDVAFSTLPGPVRRVACAVLAPLNWLGYALHRPSGRGTETAACWCKPGAGPTNS